jgi:hypothetical protein
MKGGTNSPGGFLDASGKWRILIMTIISYMTICSYITREVSMRFQSAEKHTTGE